MYSASSIEWVTRMISLSFLKCSMKFQQSLVPMGSKPVVTYCSQHKGKERDTSSRMTKCGFPIVDKIILNLLLIPPEKSPTLSPLLLHKRTFFNLSSATAGTRWLGTPLMAAYKEICSIRLIVKDA